MKSPTLEEWDTLAHIAGSVELIVADEDPKVTWVGGLLTGRLQPLEEDVPSRSKLAALVASLQNGPGPSQAGRLGYWAFESESQRAEMIVRAVPGLVDLGTSRSERLQRLPSCLRKLPAYEWLVSAGLDQADRALHRMLGARGAVPDTASYRLMATVIPLRTEYQICSEHPSTLAHPTAREIRAKVLAAKKLSEWLHAHAGLHVVKGLAWDVTRKQDDVVSALERLAYGYSRADNDLVALRTRQTDKLIQGMLRLFSDCSAALLVPLAYGLFDYETLDASNAEKRIRAQKQVAIEPKSA